MELNRLTQDLYAEGYTREQHPNFVYWSNWQNFGYRWEALMKFTWETPCGLLIRGDSDLGRGLAGERQSSASLSIRKKGLPTYSAGISAPLLPVPLHRPAL